MLRNTTTLRALLRRPRLCKPATLCKRHGTSHAAPAVAGLAAYFASLESLQAQFPTGNVARAMKEYIRRYAYRRSDHPTPSGLKFAPTEDEVIVPYNRAPDGLCSTDSQVKRSLMAVSNGTALARRQGGSGIDVVTDGDVVASSWLKSYCAAATTTLTTQSSTLSTSVTTTSTSTSTSAAETSAAPAPTVNILQGILTCGTEAHSDDDSHFFGLDEMTAARDAFCGNMTASDTPIVFKPGEDEYHQHVYTPPDNIFHKIRVSAHWQASANTDCEPFDFTEVDGFIGKNYYPAYKICQRRVDVPIMNCDPVRGQNDFWKQGGKFFRNCITWEITAADP